MAPKKKSVKEIHPHLEKFVLPKREKKREIHFERVKEEEIKEEVKEEEVKEELLKEEVKEEEVREEVREEDIKEEVKEEDLKEEVKEDLKERVVDHLFEKIDFENEAFMLLFIKKYKDIFDKKRQEAYYQNSKMAEVMNQLSQIMF